MSILKQYKGGTTNMENLEYRLEKIIIQRQKPDLCIPAELKYGQPCSDQKNRFAGSKGAEFEGENNDKKNF